MMWRSTSAAEVAQYREHRVGRGLAKAAHGGVLDHLGELLEELHLLQRRVATGDVVEDLPHPLGALAAGEALAGTDSSFRKLMK